MPSIQRLFARDSDKPADDGSDHMINLMLVVLGIVFLALILISILFFFRRARRLQMMRAKALDDEEDGLPSYYDTKHYGNNHRGLTIETKHNGRSSILVINRDNHPM